MEGFVLCLVGVPSRHTHEGTEGNYETLRTTGASSEVRICRTLTSYHCTGLLGYAFGYCVLPYFE